jgi:hypothetical protein
MPLHTRSDWARDMGSQFANAFQSGFLWLFVGTAWAGQVLARLDPTDYEIQVRSPARLKNIRVATIRVAKFVDSVNLVLDIEISDR